MKVLPDSWHDLSHTLWICMWIIVGFMGLLMGIGVLWLIITQP